ncbi:hypothetical protein ACK6WK_22110 [Citrobacter portucalensis]
MIKQLKSQRWLNAVVGDGEWDCEGLAEEGRDTDALLVKSQHWSLILGRG